ncbi:MAG: DNA photolyase [Desulfobacteraceae bacterium]
MTVTRLFIDRQVADLSATQYFIRNSGLIPEVVADTAALYQPIKRAGDPWAKAKRAVLLTSNKGAFIKECPGTREYTCCGYQILHIGSYCTMDCAYCVLQGYFHPPILQYFVNHDDLMKELDQRLETSRLARIGTGEFTDSLIWEKWSDLTPRLVNRFAGQTRSVLELKTKTTHIEKLEGLDHQRKTIISWSLNTPHIIATQERGTASLKARLRAAAQCQKWGYPLAFHFDPMVIYPNCEQEYQHVLVELFDTIRPENMVWISMGTFRFMPALKSIIEQRFTDSNIVYGEFIPGLDGKMRYFKPLRIRLYRAMARWLRAKAPDTLAYLCMEDDQVWENSMGLRPQSRGGLSAMLDESARNRCDLTS